MLKGGLALDFRLGERSRTTKHMDMVRHDDEDAAVADLIEAAATRLAKRASARHKVDRATSSPTISFSTEAIFPYDIPPILFR